jgi:hypothetical protein
MSPEGNMRHPGARREALTNPPVPDHDVMPPSSSFPA